jgi:hypothetical protein
MINVTLGESGTGGPAYPLGTVPFSVTAGRLVQL